MKGLSTFNFQRENQKPLISQSCTKSGGAMRWSSLILIMLIALAVIPSVKAESPGPWWVKTYGGSYWDETNAIAIAPNGDIIVVGWTESFGVGRGDVWVLRLDETGNVKWQKAYGGPGLDKANAVVIAPNGDIIVAGYTESFGTSGDVWILRLDKDGNVKWQKVYERSSRDEANAVAIEDNGDIIVAGSTISPDTGNDDFWILRLDENGNVIWQKTYGGSNDDGARAVMITDNGDIVVAGYTESFGAGETDIWILRLDGNGNVIWQKTYGGSYWEEARAVALANNGDIIVVGYTESFGAGSDDFWVLRLDENGNVKWQKTYGGKNSDVAGTVAIVPDSDIIVAGRTESFGSGAGDVWVLRLDENGNIKWQKTCGGNQYEDAYTVAIASNGDIIVAGYTNSFGAGRDDAWVLKLPQDGNLSSCSFCSNSKAQVFFSTARVFTSSGLVKQSNVAVKTSTAQVQNTNAEVETLWAYTPEGKGGLINSSYVIIAFIGLIVIGGVAAKVRGRKDKPPTHLAEREKPAPKKAKPVISPERPTPVPAKMPEINEHTKTIHGFPPELLDKYEPLEFLGEGGFAKVFKVTRKKDGKIVALKIPRIDEKTSKIFIKEVSTWLHLNHPNIVKLYDVDILPIPYLEMEYVEGVDINGKTIRDLGAYPKPVDEKTALKLIKGIAEGLKHAHSKGIYHRDLKPLNILLKSDLTPKITDWGLAKLGTMTSSRSVVGYTPIYASPEHLMPSRYGHTDHRTDIWQLGVTFYELLTGKLPFEGYTYEEVFGKIVDEDYRFTPPSKINPALAKYDGIFEKLLAKRRKDRYQSVDEFLNDLEKLEETERWKAELEKEVEELKKTLSKSVQALKRSTTAEEILRNRRLVVETLGKLALAYAELNRKAELLNTLNDLKFYTVQNLADLTNAINTVEMLIKENVPIGGDFIERLKVLVHNIKRENGA